MTPTVAIDITEIKGSVDLYTNIGRHICLCGCTLFKPTLDHTYECRSCGIIYFKKDENKIK